MPGIATQAQQGSSVGMVPSRELAGVDALGEAGRQAVSDREDVTAVRTGFVKHRELAAVPRANKPTANIPAVAAGTFDRQLEVAPVDTEDAGQKGGRQGSRR